MRWIALLTLFSLIISFSFVHSQDASPTKSAGEEKRTVSFKNNVLPIFEKRCLPCHAEENFNPSELSLDSRDLLMAGGKHGPAVVPGKSKESTLFLKLGPTPPFGDRMPLDKKRKKGEPSKQALSEEDVTTIGTWIDQGTPNN